jgi:hypothetical protein
MLRHMGIRYRREAMLAAMDPLMAGGESLA